VSVGRLSAGLLVTLLIMALGACSTVSSKFQAPDVQVMSVQILSSDMFAQKFKVRLKLENPNKIELPVRGLEFDVLLMGDRFAEGSSADQFILPARGEAEFDIAVTTSFVSSFGRLISRVGGGKLNNVDYEIVGKVFVDKGMLRKIPFNHRGTVDFTKALGK